MSFNKALILDNIINQVLLKLDMKLTGRENNHDNLFTRYHVKLESTGEELTMYEPTAIKLSIEGKVKVLEPVNQKQVTTSQTQNLP